MTSFWQQRLNGTVEIESLGRPTSEPAGFLAATMERFRYHWKPPYQLTTLPSWFHLSLDCYVDASGTRRFTLIEPNESDLRVPGIAQIATVRGFGLVASIGGYHLLLDHNEVRPDLLLTHDESRIFLQYIEHRREFLGQRKGLEDSLGICAGGRTDPSNKNVLPADLGLDRNGDGAKWSVADLTREGTKAANNNGLSNPTPRQILSYGLLEAARRNPLYVRSTKEVSVLMRMALFGLSESTKRLTKAQLRYVAAEVRNSLSDHLEDSNEQFSKWVEDPNSNLLHRISKRVDCKLSRSQVKQALLELGWRSLQMIGECIDVQMKAFRNAIQTPLNEKEDFYFGQVFLANPNYGLLPFLLLHDRFDELQAAVVNIWNNPADPSTVPVLHRVVSYCAELFGNRRAADQEYKRRSQAKNKGGQLAIEINIETPDGDLRPEQNFFLELTKALGVRRGIESDVGDWEARLIRQSETTIQLELRCAEPTCVKKFTVPRSEFEAVARTLRSL